MVTVERDTMLSTALTTTDLLERYEQLDTPLRADVVLIPVKDVLRLGSVDKAPKRAMTDLMLSKVQDYPALAGFFHSLVEEGFLLPVSLCNDSYMNPGQWVVGNGNHRVAVAYAIGYEYIPFALVEGSVHATFSVTTLDAARRDGLVLDEPVYYEATTPEQYRSPFIDVLREDGWVTE